VSDPGRIAGDIEARLRAAGTPERAEGSKRYLKSSLTFLGATVGQMRGEVRSVELAGHDELVALVEALWAEPVFERRLCAALLLEARVDLLRPADLPLIERLVRDSRTWALVDVLAGDALGGLLVRHPEAAGELDAWAADGDFWVRRAALLAHLEPLRAGAGFERFGRYADAMLEEREFFIRKAIGWVLRETGKQRPDEVYAWLLPRAARASGVTMREAVKYLAPEQREALLASRTRRSRGRAGTPARPRTRRARS
jgi:3-methyladenine DNA glycosylase AlkD